MLYLSGTEDVFTGLVLALRDLTGVTGMAVAAALGLGVTLGWAHVTSASCGEVRGDYKWQEVEGSQTDRGYMWRRGVAGLAAMNGQSDLSIEWVQKSDSKRRGEGRQLPNPRALVSGSCTDLGTPVCVQRGDRWRQEILVKGQGNVEWGQKGKSVFGIVWGCFLLSQRRGEALDV